MIAVRLLGQWALLGLSVYGVYHAYRADPVFGFALATAAIAFAVSIVLEFRRFLVERRFFFGPESARLTAPVIGVISGVNAIGRALVVGAAALFTFPAPSVFEKLALVPAPAGVREAEWAADTQSILGFAEGLSLDAQWTLYVLLGFIGFGVVLVLIIDRMTSGRGHRWGLFQLAGLFGILFSVAVVYIRFASAEADHDLFGDRPIFQSASANEVGVFFNRSAGLMDDIWGKYETVFLCRKLVEDDDSVPGGLRGPERDLQRKIINAATGLVMPDPFEFFGRNGCGYRLKTETGFEGFKAYCDIDDPHWQRRFTPLNNPPNVERWRRHGCDRPSVPIRSRASTGESANVPEDELIRRLLITTAVIDGFIDDQIHKAIEFSIGDRGVLREIVMWPVVVLISAKLLQGLVISVYVTLIVLLLTPRRVH